MEQSAFLHWFILPLLIFCSRILDVTIGTLRIILITRGNRLYAPLLGFFEVLLWLIVMVNVVRSLDHPVFYIAYAGGFAMGNYIGMAIEHKLAMGLSMLRVVTAKDAEELINHLRSAGYVVTEVPAHGNHGEVRVLFTVVRRREIRHLVKIVREFNPNAFYTVEDVNYVSTNYALSIHPRMGPLRRPTLAKKK